MVLARLQLWDPQHEGGESATLVQYVTLGTDVRGSARLNYLHQEISP